MTKNAINRKIITYSAGSITLKGFIAFHIIPETLTPMIRSKEIISIAEKTARKLVTKNIFTLITPLGIIFFLLFFSSRFLIPPKKGYAELDKNRFQWDKVVFGGQYIQYWEKSF